MRYLHTMVRVRDLDAALDFYVNKLGLVQTRRMDNERGRFTLVFLCAPDDATTTGAEGAPADAASAAAAANAPQVELTWNWDDEDYKGGRNFGHLAYAVDDVYVVCQRLMDGGVTINRPPRDGHMAFVRSPDGISIELLQKGGAKAPAEPWTSMPNVGEW
jgi:lactoylglutathione lyase